MSFEYPIVTRDKFEPDEMNNFLFPCSCCVHRFKLDREEPCNTCDHNCNSVPA